MTAVLACLAVALIVLPESSARRRAVLAGFTTRRRWWCPSVRIDLGYLMLAAGLPIVCFGGPHAVAAALPAAITVRVLMIRIRRERAQVAQRAYLLDGLEVVIAELQVGAHPGIAAEVAAAEGGGDPARAFAVCAARSRLGGQAAVGLRLPNSVIDAELDRVACAWAVAERHGLALAELLAAARSDLLGRIRFRDRTEAGLAGARVSAALLAGLPVLGIGLGQLMGADPLRLLLGGGVGGVLLVLGVCLVCAGLLWTEAITRRVVRG